MEFQLYYGCFLASFTGSILSKYSLSSQIITLLLIFTTFFLGIYLERKISITEKYLDTDKYKKIYNKVYSGIKKSLNKEDDEEEEGPEAEAEESTDTDKIINEKENKKDN